MWMRYNESHFVAFGDSSTDGSTFEKTNRLDQ